MKKNNSIYYLIVLSLFLILKLLYTILETSDLYFILKPVSNIIKVITGEQYYITDEHSFFFEKIKITIDKSCSGINFLLITFVMTSFLVIKKSRFNTNMTINIIICLFISYIYTILINSSRIYTSIILESNLQVYLGSITHEVIGTITNLTALILFFTVIEHIQKNEKFIKP